jgi:Protein of unknown function (DUF1353)
MGFGPRADVYVKEIDDKNWALTVPIDYQGEREPFVVPVDMETDFASVPRVFVWFLPRYGRYTKAAILHDFLWRKRAAEGTLSWLDADAIFRRAMRELHVPFLRRWILWAAVRYAALTKKGGLKGWWKESWRVLLITLVALPIVAIPAVIILIALAVFFLVELLFWVLLSIARLFRTRVMKQTNPKEVPLPTFQWRIPSKRPRS